MSRKEVIAQAIWDALTDESERHPMDIGYIDPKSGVIDTRNVDMLAVATEILDAIHDGNPELCGDGNGQSCGRWVYCDLEADHDGLHTGWYEDPTIGIDKASRTHWGPIEGES